MANKNTTGEITTPSESMLKDRKSESVQRLVRKIRTFRWFCFVILGIGLLMLEDILPESIFSFIFPTPSEAFVFFFMVLLPAACWYASHCVKFPRAWERMVVLRLGKRHSKPVRKPGLRWIWYFIDRPIFVRVDQRVKSIEVSIFSADDIETKIETIIVWMVSESRADDYVINVSDAEGSLIDIAEASIRNAIGHKSFNDIKKEGKKAGEEATKTTNEKITQQSKCWGIEVVQILFKDVDPQSDILEKLQGVFKASKDEEIAQINARIEVIKGRARGEAEAASITPVVRAMGDMNNYLARESVGAIKPTDKTIILGADEAMNSIARAVGLKRFARGHQSLLS